MAKEKAAVQTPAESLAAMLRRLRARCPVLCPSVVPAGLADAEQGVALLALCADAAERTALATLLRSARAGRGACALTACEVADEGALRFVSRWELDPAAGAYRLLSCDFVCAEAALLLDTAAMLERFSRTDADAKELGRLAQLFCAANQHADEPARSAVEARLWLQECLSLAAACQVVASSLPYQWRVLGPDSEPLRGRSALAIAQGILGASPESASKKKKAKAAKASHDAAAVEEAPAPASAAGAKAKQRKRARTE